jgi:hypothetical protein
MPGQAKPEYAYAFFRLIVFAIVVMSVSRTIDSPPLRPRNL